MLSNFPIPIGLWNILREFKIIANEDYRHLNIPSVRNSASKLTKEAVKIIIAEYRLD